jgi:hypothetical protein
MINRNTNGSVDVGIMQINSVHFKSLKDKFGIDPSYLVHHNCANIFYAAHILRESINREGTFWKGVGSYHSRTEDLNLKYQRKIAQTIKDHQGSARMMASTAYYTHEAPKGMAANKATVEQQNFAAAQERLSALGVMKQAYQRMLAEKTVKPDAPVDVSRQASAMKMGQ